MITALIRTHPGREKLTERAIKSAQDEGCLVEVYHGEVVEPYLYNDYCNKLKESVTEGFFFFLDSDDFVIKGSIKKAERLLKRDRANIVRMLRNGKPKPMIRTIRMGSIGMPCLILHASHKNIADVENQEYGDYAWIKKVSLALRPNYIMIPVVNAGKRNYGK